MLNHLSKAPITFNRLATLLVHAVRGSVDEQAALVVSLASGGGKSATSGQVVAYVEAVATSYLDAAAQKWTKLPKGPTKQLAAGLCHDLLFPGRHTKETLLTAAPEDLAVTEMEASKWLSAAPVGLLAMQAAIFDRLFFETDPSAAKDRLLPLCKGFKEVKSSILDQAAVAFLASAVPSDFRKEWRFLFSSTIHGESFSKMLGSVVWQGPTIIIIRDTTGHVFGGFAVENWNTGPKFVGKREIVKYKFEVLLTVYLLWAFRR